MKALHGSASASVAASAHDTLTLLSAVGDYPLWHPDVVRHVEILDRDAQGNPISALARLRVARGPLSSQLEMTLAIERGRPDTVTLTRLAHDQQDEEEFEATWRVTAAPQTLVELTLSARLDVPRALPLGGIGEAMAGGFVAAAARALDDRGRSLRACS